MLGAAFASGVCSVGGDVSALGVVPTGCVSFIARQGDYGAGAVISASHNPAADNGIKLLGHDGAKLSEGDEETIEGLLGGLTTDRPIGGGVGSLSNDRSPITAYSDFLHGLVPEGLNGIKVAVDAANGAAYELATDALKRLGAEVVVTGDAPDGMNINKDCGATKPEVMQRLTVESGADVGIAFDGDADRAVFSDEKGRLINGDRTMAIWCAHWSKASALEPAVVVGTVMSNGGFEKFINASGVRLERTPVGDRNVSAKLKETGARIGGEQSGHIIFPAHLPTGDGLVTALEFLRVIKREGRPTSEFYGEYESWPQVLINVSVSDQNGWAQRPNVAGAIDAAKDALVEHGRIVVRASGTQPMIRVMVEADCADLRDTVAESIVETLRTELGGKIYSRVDLTHALGD